MSRSGHVRSWKIVAATLLAVFALGLSACGRRRQQLPRPSSKAGVEVRQQHPQDVVPEKWELPPAGAPREPAVRVPDVVSTFGRRVLRGEANVGSAERVSGPGIIDVDAIGRIVRGHTGGLRACYERALPGHPTLSGRLALRFVVGVRGRATEVTSTGFEGEPMMTQCVAGRVRGMVFPMSEGGDVTVEVPVKFTPGG